METMKLFKKIRKFLKYHIGPKEVVFDHEYDQFLPKNIMDYSDYCVYVINYDKKIPSLKCIISHTSKGIEV